MAAHGSCIVKIEPQSPSLDARAWIGRLTLAVVLIGLSACVTARREDYAGHVHTIDGGRFLFLLSPMASADKGTSLVGPFRFGAAAQISDTPALPETCRVTYRAMSLADDSGKIVANPAMQQVSPKVVMGASGKLYAPMIGQKSAGFSDSTALALPYAAYTLSAEIALEGCGALDGVHQVRGVLTPAPEHRLANPGWDRLMSV